MCGICGEAGSRKFVEANRAIVQSMTDKLRHRGPDDEGFWIGTDEAFGVNLGVRRLAIIDRKRGHQPPDHPKIHVVFNGEIYNHHHIRKMLQQTYGMEFKTTCDTEVVAAAWDHWGSDCLKHLEGMFAMAVYNEETETLYLARDRMGKKPLFFYWEPAVNLLVWASELKALISHPKYTKAVSLQGLFDYLLLQYVPEPRTAFRDIAALEPGEFIRYNPRQGLFSKHSYWQLRPNMVNVEDDEDAARQVEKVVRYAVHSRLESEVPLGIYLSGGIDSSLVTALACEAKPANQLYTFTMGFENPQYDETRWGKMIADRYGTNHIECTVGALDIEHIAYEILDIYDQPFGDCSAIPTLIMARESKQAGLTVALTGDGGDEAFGGYTRYRVTNPAEGLNGYLPYIFVWPEALRNNLWRHEYRRRVRAHEAIAQLSAKAVRHPSTDAINQMGYLDSLTYLVGDIIVKMERATMSTSVEARCPFLDHNVFELAFSIPSQYKIHRDWTKLPLRRAFSNLVPTEIWDRPKMGFGVPIGDWLKTPAAGPLLDATVFGKDQWVFNPDTVRTLTESHLAGRNELGHPLWVLIMAYLWLHKHFA